VPITVKEVYVDGNMKKKNGVNTSLIRTKGIRADTTVEGLSKLKPGFRSWWVGDSREFITKPLMEPRFVGRG